MEGYQELTPELLKTPEGLNELNRMLQSLFNNMPGDGNTVRVYSGYGVPTIAAGAGSIYQRLDGGTNTSVYINEAGMWVAK